NNKELMVIKVGNRDNLDLKARTNMRLECHNHMEDNRTSDHNISRSKSKGNHQIKNKNKFRNLKKKKKEKVLKHQPTLMLMNNIMHCLMLREIRFNKIFAKNISLSR